MRKSPFFAMLVLAAIAFLPTQILFAKTADKAPEAKSEEKRVAAKVGGREITTAELDEAAKQDLMPLATQIYQAKKQRLDQMIQDALFEQEAKAQKKSVEEIKKQANTAPTTMSDDAVETYFDLNQTRYQGKQLADVKEKTRRTPLSRKRRRVRLIFSRILRKNID